jgi:hypothetical protein
VKSEKDLLTPPIETLEVSIKSRTSYTGFLKLGGMTFELSDLYADLSSIENDEPIYWPYTDEVGRTYLKLEIIDTMGHREGYRAGKGPNFDAYFAQVKKLMKKVPDNTKWEDVG